MDVTLKETIKIIKGIIILDLIVLVAALLFRKLDAAFLSGLAFGSIYAILNFRLIAITLKKAVKMPTAKAQMYVGVNYFIRLALSALVIFIAIRADYINVLSAIIPMFFPKLIIIGLAIMKKI